MALALLWAGCFCPEVPLEEEDGPSPELPTTDDPEELEDSGNATIYSFGASKRMLPDIFKGHAETFYCGCPFNGKKVQFKGCGYKVRKNKTRASRLEWEHVVPAAAFGRSFTPWSEGNPKCKNSKQEPYKGRRCATKISKKFRRMEAD
ncbi:MAG: hypothetical protein AAFS10_22465, partial [Myxococcota bacterium]